MTSLVRFSPTNELRRMQREIDRLFDDFVPARGSGDGERETTTWSPRVDLTESDDAYMVHLDAPGMTKDDFNINWQDDTLTISGERTWASDDRKEDFVRVERSYGHFFRSFRLPKAEESRPRRIEIQ